MSKGAIGGRALAAFGVSALALGAVLVSPAAGAQETPPGWVDPGANAWVAFTLDSYSPSPDGRSSYAPVTLERHSSGPVDVAWFDNWEGLDTDAAPGADQWRWPLVWEPAGSSIRLARVDDCDYTQDSCRYSIVDGNGASFWFFGGTPPLGINNQPDPDPATYAEGPLALPALPTIQIGAPQAVETPGTGSGAGKIHLTAPGTADQLAGTTLTYTWVLVHVASGTTYNSGPSANDFFEPTVQDNGSYCVEITVTASDGHTVSTPTCSGGGTGGGIFNAVNVAPVPGGGGGGGGGTPPPAGGGGGGGGGIPGIGFSNPAQRAPSSLTGGGGAPAAVIWLWRPEWYQPTPEPRDLPRTSGQPVTKGRRDIVVSGPAPHGSNAGPWIAGVGIFGALGGGWLVSRRRRMRMLAEL
ncbi:MAG: hypothetical protein WD598_12390 [Acidimicrobiia bacterium]